jgi:hypothetical protein
MTPATPPGWDVEASGPLVLALGRLRATLTCCDSSVNIDKCLRSVLDPLDRLPLPLGPSFGHGMSPAKVYPEPPWAG